MRREALDRRTIYKVAARLTIALLLMLLALGAQACTHFRPGGAKPPSVLYIATDDLGGGDLACYGGAVIETPNLDRLAADGMRFTNAYGAAPVGSASFAAALTGKFPARLGLTDSADARRPAPDRTRPLQEPSPHSALGRSEPTVARAFGSAGYEPALFGKWDMSITPLMLGFDTYQADSEALALRPDKDPARTDRLTSLAERFLEENGHRPFFLCVRYHPAVPPKPDLLRHYTEKIGTGGAIAPDHAARVADLDANVGHLLAKLGELKLRGKVLVVFTSDNGVPGPATANAPLRGTAGTLYEGGIRVPLIVRWPGVTAGGGVSDALVSSVDHAPTLMEAGQLDPKAVGLPATDGVSFVGLLRGEPATDRHPICWHYPHYGAGAPAGAARSDDWKLIEFFEDMHVALYNLADDPGETKDLAAAQPDQVAALRELLHRWRIAVGAKMPTPNPTYRAGK